MTPKFQHDCTSCHFLSWAPLGAKGHDLYFCPEEEGGSLVCRFGDNGAEYRSLDLTLAQLSSAEVFKVALNEAKLKGYIK